jgi:excisionase family DNA binding protein
MLEMDERYMTVPEVAETLGVSRHTVYRWIRQKHLSAYRLGHEMRISESALKEFLEERRTDREDTP